MRVKEYLVSIVVSRESDTSCSRHWHVGRQQTKCAGNPCGLLDGVRLRRPPLFTIARALARQGSSFLPEFAFPRSATHLLRHPRHIHPLFLLLPSLFVLGLSVLVSPLPPTAMFLETRGGPRSAFAARRRSHRTAPCLPLLHARLPITPTNSGAMFPYVHELPRPH